MEKSILFLDEFTDLIHDQARWSQEVFGRDTDRGPIGALRHLEKEAIEARDAWIEGNRNDIEMEFADCFLLLMDASRRAGIQPMRLVECAKKKMEINKRRSWPKPVDDMPVEHDRAEVA